MSDVTEVFPDLPRVVLGSKVRTAAADFSAILVSANACYPPFTTVTSASSQMGDDLAAASHFESSGRSKFSLVYFLTEGEIMTSFSQSEVP